MINTIQTDEEILDTLCVPIGEFRVPRTLGDFRSLLEQIHKKIDATTLAIIMKKHLLQNNYDMLEHRGKSTSGIMEEEILDGTTRYHATILLRGILAYEEGEAEQRAERTRLAAQEIAAPPQHWMSRLASWTKLASLQ